MEGSMPHEDATDALGRAMYGLICSRDGISAREMARALGSTRKEINQRLYTCPFVRDLCYHDDAYRWHGLICQRFPHDGLRDFCGWYGYVDEFMAQPEGEWMDELASGCRRVGRSLNDTRGLLHSFADCREVMRDAFADLVGFGVACQRWELAFELRIRRARWVRIYADVLVVCPTHAFSLELKMKDAVEPAEVAQAAKYVPWLEVIFGREVDVVPALVLTRARDLYAHAELPGGGELPVASKDMLFNVFDEYLGFLG